MSLASRLSAIVGAAFADLRTAGGVWRELGLPYEEAQTRLMIGIATRALGDEEGASREIEAASHAFEMLGARADLRRAATLLAPTTLPAGLTARELDVLRLVTSSARPDDEAQKKISAVESRLMSDYGYNEHSAREALSYVTTLLSQE